MANTATEYTVRAIKLRTHGRGLTYDHQRGHDRYGMPELARTPKVYEMELVPSRDDLARVENLLHSSAVLVGLCHLCPVQCFTDCPGACWYYTWRAHVVDAIGAAGRDYAMLIPCPVQPS
jgi:hypothetical protein